MSHWIIAPVILPGIMAAFLVLAARDDLALQRMLSVAATLVLLGIAVGLLTLSLDGVPRPYFLGAWPPPFGIILVLDRLSAIMVLLTAILAVAVALHAMSGLDRAGRHFHPIFQFQLMGVNGAFLTGDLFNLFVFFEVLLISSYGLMLHGGGAARFTGGIKYIAINLVGSALFLFAVGLIYAVTGGLNMADLAVKVPLVAERDRAILEVGGALLLIVFAIKSALVPLHVWLPGTYSAAAAPVAALFAIMTKVGGYAIVRVYTLIFGPGAGETAWLAAPWVLPAAQATLVLGALGLLASRDLGRLASYALIGSMGLMLTGIGLFTATSLAAGLYYLVHSTLAAAALFLLIDLVAQRRGAWGDRLEAGPAFPQAGLLAACFLLAGIAMVGLPPLPGFIGKLLVLDAAFGAPWWGWIWTVVLVTSLLGIIAFGRAGSVVFWKISGEPQVSSGPLRRAAPLTPAMALLGLTGVLMVLSGPVTELLDSLAAQLLDRQDYVRAVLAPQGISLRPAP